jgi:hypothetical protein
MRAIALAILIAAATLRRTMLRRSVSDMDVEEKLMQGWMVIACLICIVMGW